MTLDALLDATAPASLVVVQGYLSAPGWPVVRELVARGVERGQQQLMVCLLYPPEAVGTAPSLDLTRAVPGFSDLRIDEEIVNTCASLPPTAQVTIDAIDVLAEDVGTPAALRVIRALLSTLKSGRLIVATRGGEFAQDLLAASLSPSLAHVVPHHPALVEALSRTYLTQTDEARWPVLETATQRGAGDALVLSGPPGGSLMTGTPPELGVRDAWVIQLLVRKAAGGAKGIQRSIEGFVRRQAGVERWAVAPLADVADLKSVAPADKATTTHADLMLPFNLGLTEQQREARGAVPLPYAHEGEGADLGMGMDWEDDEEDDEI